VPPPTSCHVVFTVRDHLSGTCGLYRSNGQPVTRGAVWEQMALCFNGRRRLYGLQLSAEPHTKPRLIVILDMVEVEELRDPAECIQLYIRLWLAAGAAG